MFRAGESENSAQASMADLFGDDDDDGVEETKKDSHETKGDVNVTATSPGESGENENLLCVDEFA